MYYSQYTHSSLFRSLHFLPKVGRKFIQTLNRFQKLAYERLNHTPNEQPPNRPSTPMGRQHIFGRSPTPTDHLVAG
jgi:hypothetical protein